MAAARPAGDSWRPAASPGVFPRAQGEVVTFKLQIYGGFWMILGGFWAKDLMVMNKVWNVK